MPLSSHALTVLQDIWDLTEGEGRDVRSWLPLIREHHP
jgi:hypothetical protein